MVVKKVLVEDLKGPLWDLLAVPIGNVETQPHRRGTRLDTPEVAGLRHPVLRDSIPRWLDYGAVRHVPSYVLRVPQGVEPPQLSSSQSALLEELSHGAFKPEPRRSNSSRSAEMKAMEAAFGLDSEVTRRPTNARAMIARAVALGMLTYEKRSDATLTVQQVIAVAHIALGAPARDWSPQNTYKAVQANGPDHVVRCGFEIGSLMVGKPYAAFEYENLMTRPGVLSSAVVV